MLISCLQDASLEAGSWQFFLQIHQNWGVEKKNSHGEFLGEPEYIIYPTKVELELFEELKVEMILLYNLKKER